MQKADHPSQRKFLAARQDPRDATAAYGKECFAKSVEMVRQMFAEAGLIFDLRHDFLLT